jgi:hypothetical protein
VCKVMCPGCTNKKRLPQRFCSEEHLRLYHAERQMVLVSATGGGGGEGQAAPSSDLSSGASDGDIRGGRGRGAGSDLSDSEAEGEGVSSGLVRLKGRARVSTTGRSALLLPLLHTECPFFFLECPF